jgi:hypothetical protein
MKTKTCVVVLLEAQEALEVITECESLEFILGNGLLAKVAPNIKRIADRLEDNQSVLWPSAAAEEVEEE